jgi:hypothetical protein
MFLFYVSLEMGKNEYGNARFRFRFDRLLRNAPIRSERKKSMRDKKTRKERSQR